MPHQTHPINVERYSRQIRFSDFGEQGQQNLSGATAAIVGCGALGSAQAQLLVRAGVGALRLIDRDYVEESNLQRQVLYTENDAQEGLPKAEAARRHLLRANSGVRCDAFTTDLNSANAEELLSGADVILDGSDNFETRYLINDVAVRDGIPWIYGGAVGAYGIAMPVIPGRTACLRCVYPELPAGAQPTCETAGIFGSVTSLIAAIQAMDALKILAGRAERVRHVITTADLWTGPLRERPMPERAMDCPACALREFPFLSGAKRAPVSLCGRNAVQIHERTRPVDLKELATRLEQIGAVRANNFALHFHDGKHELTLFPDGRAIVKGTTDPGIARGIYSRFIGN